MEECVEEINYFFRKFYNFPFPFFKMFFPAGTLEKLPKGLQRDLEIFYKEYKQASDLFEEGKKADKQMADAVIKSLEIYLKWFKKVDKKTRDLIGEGVGEIPVMMIVDKIKLSKELDEIVGPLMDIDVSGACKKIDREKFIRETLEKLKGLRKKLKG